jgi:hypothetical protein
LYYRQLKEEIMSVTIRPATLLVAVAVVLGLGVRGRAHQASSLSPRETSEAQIARALSAAPEVIAKSARVVDTDSQGKTVVLREGTNGFTCMPGNPKVIGQPAMCEDAASQQWSADFKAHKPKPTNTVPGITYMLAGATQRSDSDPFDKTSPPITVGPHWMIMWPFDPKATGLPATHRDKGSYIMWAGSPYAHLHVMGRPDGSARQ